MKLTETQDAQASKVTVRKDDPDAIRVKFTGFPPGELDSRHKDFEPSGELMPGEYGMAKPAMADQPDYMWHFTSDRGFSITIPPHDVKKSPKETRYPNLGTTEQQLMKSPHLAGLSQ